MTAKSAHRAAANAEHAQVLAGNPTRILTSSEEVCPVCDSNAFAHNVEVCREARDLVQDPAGPLDGAGCEVCDSGDPDHDRGACARAEFRAMRCRDCLRAD